MASKGGECGTSLPDWFNDASKLSLSLSLSLCVLRSPPHGHLSWEVFSTTTRMNSVMINLELCATVCGVTVSTTTTTMTMWNVL